jgi:uncharacterized membrane protein YebE (DUF533 family)
MNHELDHGNLKDAQIEELKGLFKAALADGRISTKELTQIQFYYYDSHLSEKDFSALKDDIFQDVVQAAIADHIVTPQEETSILRIAKQLNISAASREWAHQQIELYSNGKKS